MHELKTWQGPFDAILAGDKRFEIRVDDRIFAVGDTLRLREYHPIEKRYSGRSVDVLVTYLTKGTWGLPADLCVMSIAPIAHTYVEYVRTAK